jgi:hypothetical protein
MQERCKPFAIPPFTAFFKLEGKEGCYCGAVDKTMKKLYLDRWSNKTGFFPSVLLGKSNSIVYYSRCIELGTSPQKNKKWIKYFHIQKHQL